PIDGIGFQSHISLNSPDISTIQAHLQKVVDIRPKIKVKITELDVRMNNEGGIPLTYLTSERADEQKQYYYNIVKTYLETVPEDQRGGITIWGVIDEDSWLQNWPEPTTEWPLLFF
ncbi:endo-1,4-beta-xylanase, partial [Pseudoalteromonas sp. AC71-MNA-CIBAN-0107]